jgi:hypothetical protein
VPGFLLTKMTRMGAATVRTCTLLALLLCALTAPAIADRPAPPKSYVVETQDGNHVFVMLAPTGRHTHFRLIAQRYRGQIAKARTEPASADRDRRIAETELALKQAEERMEQVPPLETFEGYTESGLYEKGSTEPLWTVDSYAFGVHLSPNGKYLVQEGPWAMSPEQLGVSFCANGELLRAWSIDDLVDEPENLPHSMSHFRWRVGGSGKLDSEKLLFSLTTLEDRILVFDLRTGQQVASPGV